MTEAEKATGAENATEETTTATTTEETQAQGKSYTQADVDSITEKVRKTEARARAKLEAELAAVKRANETEAEKAIREAEERGASEAKAELERLKKSSALKDMLLAEGIDPQRVSAAVRLADDYEDAAEEAKRLKESLPEWFGGGTTKRQTGADGRTAHIGDDFDPADPEQVDEYIRTHGIDAYAKKRDAIRSAQNAKFGGIRKL